jgi:hypothetical protein
MRSLLRLLPLLVLLLAAGCDDGPTDVQPISGTFVLVRLNDDALPARIGEEGGSVLELEEETLTFRRSGRVERRRTIVSQIPGRSVLQRETSREVLDYAVGPDGSLQVGSLDLCDDTAICAPNDVGEWNFDEIVLRTQRFAAGTEPTTLTYRPR